MTLSTSRVTDITLASLVDRWGGGEFDFLMWGPQDSSGVYVFVRFAGERRFASYRVTDAFFSFVLRGKTNITIAASVRIAQVDQALSPSLPSDVSLSSWLVLGGLMSNAFREFEVNFEITTVSNLRIRVARNFGTPTLAATHSHTGQFASDVTLSHELVNVNVTNPHAHDSGLGDGSHFEGLAHTHTITIPVGGSHGHPQAAPGVAESADVAWAILRA